MHDEQPAICGIALEGLRQFEQRICEVRDVVFHDARRHPLHLEVERQWPRWSRYLRGFPFEGRLRRVDHHARRIAQCSQGRPGRYDDRANHPARRHLAAGRRCVDPPEQNPGLERLGGGERLCRGEPVDDWGGQCAVAADAQSVGHGRRGCWYRSRRPGERRCDRRQRPGSGQRRGRRHTARENGRRGDVWTTPAVARVRCRPLRRGAPERGAQIHREERGVHLLDERRARREQWRCERRAVPALNLTDSREHTDGDPGCGEIRFDAPVRGGPAR